MRGVDGHRVLSKWASDWMEDAVDGPGASGAVSKKARPTPTPDTEAYWEGTRLGELRLQRCGSCGTAFFYPRSSCPRCGSAEVSSFSSAGRGRLHTYVISHRAAPGFEADVPYAIAVVELDEGPRLLTNIVGIENTPEQLTLDMAVQVEFEPRGEQMVPVFRPSVPS